MSLLGVPVTSFRPLCEDLLPFVFTHCRLNWISVGFEFEDVSLSDCSSVDSSQTLRPPQVLASGVSVPVRFCAFPTLTRVPRPSGVTKGSVDRLLPPKERPLGLFLWRRPLCPDRLTTTPPWDFCS